MKKNFTISIPVERLIKVYLPVGLIIAAVGGFLGLFFIDRIVMPNLTGVTNRGVLEVPAVVGLEWEAARQKMYDIGLVLKTQGKEYNDTLPAGTVLIQQPAPGTSVKKGHHIMATTSDGPEISVVPVVSGLNERLSKNTILKAGFKEIGVKFKYSEEVEKDKVVSIEPDAGTQTSRESPINIVISKGPRPTHAVVPNLIGEMLSDVKDKVEEAGLTLGTISYSKGAGGTVGSVISQSVSPGSKAPLDSGIDIVVSVK